MRKSISQLLLLFAAILFTVAVYLDPSPVASQEKLNIFLENLKNAHPSKQND